MKLKLLSAFVLLPALAFASEPSKGYRGFVDWDNNVTTYDVWYDGNAQTYFYTGVSTTHGYQINSLLFVGAGLAVERCLRSDSYIVPLFLDVRADLKFDSFTPFGDLRAGYSFTDGGGVFIAPTIGYRFNWGRKSGINIGVGLTVKQSHYDLYDFYNPFPNHDTGYLTSVYLGRESRFKAHFSFRIGIDF